MLDVYLFQKMKTLDSQSSDMADSQKGIAGTVKDVKTRSGQILVECSKKVHVDNLMHANTLAGVPMKAFLHPYLNSSKGIIRSRELQDMDELEKASELEQQGVTSVKRITK